MIGDRVRVDLSDAALLGSHRPREVPEVVHRERQVGGQRLADRLAVVPGLGDRELLQVLLDPIRDPVEDVGAFGHRCPAPLRRGGVRGVQGEVDVRGTGAGDLTEHLTVDR